MQQEEGKEREDGEEEPGERLLVFDALGQQAVNGHNQHHEGEIDAPAIADRQPVGNRRIRIEAVYELGKARPDENPAGPLRRAIGELRRLFASNDRRQERPVRIDEGPAKGRRNDEIEQEDCCDREQRIQPAGEEIVPQPADDTRFCYRWRQARAIAWNDAGLSRVAHDALTFPPAQRACCRRS